MRDRIKKLFNCSGTSKSTAKVSVQTTSTATSSLLLEDFLSASTTNEDKAPDIMDMDKETMAHFQKKSYKSESSFTCCLFSKKEQTNVKNEVTYNINFASGSELAMTSLGDDVTSEEGGVYHQIPEL